MIAVDTSAIMSLLLNEPEAKQISICISENDLLMSAGTYAELMIVSSVRNLNAPARKLVSQLGIKIEVVDGHTAEEIQEAYMKWGKGKHPASLNFGDCFAYVLAKKHDIPLLYIGNDFSKTDLVTALEKVR